MSNAAKKTAAKKTTAKKAGAGGAKGPSQARATSASQWRQQRGTPLEVPSGNVCLVRKPDLRNILSGGNIPDALTAVVRAGITDPDKAVKELEGQVDDPDVIFQFMDMVDAIVLGSVIEPTLAKVPEDEEGNRIPLEDRDELEDGLWIDEVDLDDRIFITDWAVSGAGDLKPFRS